jgi:hypothetical protein
MSKDTYLLLAVLSLFLAGVIFSYGSASHILSSDTSTQVASFLAEFKSVDLGISFDYQSGTKGYSLTQPETETENASSIVKRIVLTRENDQALADTATVAFDAPLTITLTIYNNEKNQQPRDWANDHKTYSNIELRVSEPAALSISGANALRYTTEGLYRTDNVVIVHEGKVYLFSGSYFNENSQIHKDFLELLGTIEFIGEKSVSS